AHLHLRDLCGELRRERVVDAVLDEEAIAAHAGLAGIAVLRRDRAVDGRVEIGVVEYEERRVAAELERHLLHRRRALRHQLAPDVSRTSERELPNDRVRG